SEMRISKFETISKLENSNDRNGAHPTGASFRSFLSLTFGAYFEFRYSSFEFPPSTALCHAPPYLAVHLFPFDRLALVELPLALADAQFQFRQPVLEVDRQRDQR